LCIGQQSLMADVTRAMLVDGHGLFLSRLTRSRANLLGSCDSIEGCCLFNPKRATARHSGALWGWRTSCYRMGFVFDFMLAMALVYFCAAAAAFIIDSITCSVLSVGETSKMTYGSYLS